MQGWLPSLVASCPQALRLTRAEDIFVLQTRIFTVFVFVFFIAFVFVFVFGACNLKDFWLTRDREILVLERSIYILADFDVEAG